MSTNPSLIRHIGIQPVPPEPPPASILKQDAVLRIKKYGARSPSQWREKRGQAQMLGIILTITAMFVGVCFVFRSEADDGKRMARRPESPFWEHTRH